MDIRRSRPHRLRHLPHVWGRLGGGAVVAAFIMLSPSKHDQIFAQTLKPAAEGSAPADVSPAGPMDFPAPGEAQGIGKMPKGDGALAQIRKKYFYLGELTWRGGFVMAKETSDWGESRKNSIEQDIFRQASTSNNSKNVSVPASQNSAMNYMVGIEGLLGVNIDQLPGLRNAQWAKDKKFLRIGFHGYMAPLYKNTTQTVAGDFAYYDALALTPTRTYPGTVQVDESLLTFSPGMSFFYWYERGFFDHKLMPYAGFEVGLSIVYGKRKYSMNAGTFSTTEIEGGTPTQKTYSVEANLQESIINDFGFRFMPAIGFQYHIKSGHYLDVRIGYQIQEYNVTLNRRGSLTETKKDAAGNFAVTWSEDFLVKTESRKLSQSGIVILLGYTAGLF